jgi:hypothetical protein
LHAIQQDFDVASEERVRTAHDVLVVVARPRS